MYVQCHSWVTVANSRLLTDVFLYSLAWSQWQEDLVSESPKGITEEDEVTVSQRPQSMSPSPSELDEIPSPKSRHHSLEQRYQRKSASPAPRPLGGVDNYRLSPQPPASPPESSACSSPPPHDQLLIDSQPPSLDTRDTPPASPPFRPRSISHSPPPSPTHSRSSPSPQPRPTLETRKTPPPVRRASKDVIPPPSSFKGSSSPPKPAANSSPKGKPSPFRRKMAM